MKTRAIGIIGGAGPLAGAFLLERILSLSSSVYGCCKDADFPEVFLISYPFSEMLSLEMDIQQVRKELSQCLKQLRKNGSVVLAIACNTLHAFLDEKEDLTDLVHLQKVLSNEIDRSDVPLVLCTSTSVQFALHKRFFPCVYPDAKTQKEVDSIIDQILGGFKEEEIKQKIQEMIQKQTEKSIVLGCTELSLYKKHLSICNKLIIDPLEILAKKVLENSFQAN